MLLMKPALFVLALAALPLAAPAAVLPDTIGVWHRASSAKPALSDQAVWHDYSLKDWETATYQNGTAHFTANAWQLADTTGALAAFDWQSPADAKPSKAVPGAAETATGLLWTKGNYLFDFEGYKPSAAELDAIGSGLKNVDHTALPMLPGYLPSAGLVPNSLRYITGPKSLARFDPAIPASVAGFNYDAEAQTGVFHTPKGDMLLAIFNYPTPQIAMDKVADFAKLPGAVARRSGPLVAVVTGASDPAAALALVANVQFEGQITRNEYVPTARDNMGNLLLNICILIGILAAFALLSGLLFGGMKYLLRIVRRGPEPEAMITLHLE